MAEAQITVECGFCLRKDEELPSPKTLPCSHVHCLQCLTGYYIQYHMLMCPTQGCGEIVEGPPDTLPTYEMGEDNKCCDVCIDKKIDNGEAVVYCTVCSSKFCENHLMLHDDMMGKHKKISIEEYGTQAMRLQIKTCTKHNDQPYAVGCKLCLTIGCVKCFSKLTKCDKDTSHDLMSLENLVAVLMKEEMRTKVMAKEELYEKLFKVASQVRADYEKKSTELIQQIRETRDVQINALKLKYQKIEDELVEKRQKSGVDMAEFMEEVVLKKWTQLRNCRKLVESCVRCSHQVDIVKGFKELKDELMKKRKESRIDLAGFMGDAVLKKWTQLKNRKKMSKSQVKYGYQVDIVKGFKELNEELHKLVEEELPKLQLTNELQLRKLNDNRAVELEVVSFCDVVIDCEGVTTLQLLPQAMELLKSVKLPAYPISVCQYNNSTYIGLYNRTVTRIDNNNYQLYNSFISTSGSVESISVYKDRFYTLSYGNPRVVNVYDMSGGHITSWRHPQHASYSNMLTIVADQVVVTDPANHRITIYSLTGESLRHIPCPLLSYTHTTLCAVGNTSVVISSQSTSKVFRINITTGEVMWTFSGVDSPQGLVRYGSYILLAAHKSKSIYILDTTTGTIVYEIVDSAIGGDLVRGLEVNSTTLIVPKYHSQQVLFYQLNKK